MGKLHSFSSEVYRQGINYLVDVPAEISMSLATSTHVPVVGTVNGQSFRGTMVPVAGGRHRLYLNSEMRKSVNAAVGDTVAIRCQRDTTSGEPPMPDDFNAALDTVAGAKHRWDGCSPAHRRELLSWINDARKPETRARRIARAVAHVMDDM